MEEFHRYLAESIGCDRIARIDFTVPASQHNAEFNHFKRGEARVKLIVIKCARGYSYDPCPNLILASLEYATHRPISNSRDESEGESDRPRLRTELEATSAAALGACASVLPRDGSRRLVPATSSSERTWPGVNQASVSGVEVSLITRCRHASCVAAGTLPRQKMC